MDRNNYGDILSYRPIIKVPTVNNSNYDSTYNENELTTIEYTYYDENKNYTQIISDICSYQPNYVYSDLLDVINNIKDYLKHIEIEYSNKIVANTTVDKYINKIKDGEISSYNDIEEVLKDKNSNSIVEVYLELNKELNYLEKIKETFLEINYSNKNISLKECEDKDSLILKKVKEYEGENTEKINYLSLNIDTKTNMVLQGFIEGVNIYSQDLFYLIPMDREHNAPNDETVKNGLNKVFEDLTEYNIKDLRKLEIIKNKGNISNILKHINNSKVDLMELLDASEYLSDDSNDYAMYVDNVYNRKVAEIDDMISDLFKETSLLTMYKDDYISTITQKEYLRKVFLKF